MSDTGESELTIWKIILGVEFFALLIGLVMPVTPSKTGSDFSMAELFFRDPSYLQEVMVYFALTNALLGLLALIVWVGVRIESSRSRRP